MEATPASSRGCCCVVRSMDGLVSTEEATLWQALLKAVDPSIEEPNFYADVRQYERISRRPVCPVAFADIVTQCAAPPPYVVLQQVRS